LLLDNEGNATFRPRIRHVHCPLINCAKRFALYRRQSAFSVVSQGAHLFCRLPYAALRGACLGRVRTSSTARDTSCHVSRLNQSAPPPLAAVQIARPGRQRSATWVFNHRPGRKTTARLIRCQHFNGATRVNTLHLVPTIRL